MVCVPCFIIPLLLFLWHKFVQPYVLRFWNPWAVKDADGNEMKTEFPFKCEGGVCAFKKTKPNENNTGVEEKPTEVTEALQKDAINVKPDGRLKSE